jgi:glycosyltransferase involved in cell wall biosynthesis
MKEVNPKVTVIIPTYNRAHLIKRAIKSVLNQTFQDFEIIVVDDGSTDNTEEVVKSFNDLRIKYIKHQKNLGASAARNTGIKNSKGEYIAFLDSDDEWLSEKLERQIKIFEETKDKRLGFVYCGAIFIDEKKNKEIKRLLPKKRGDVYKDMLFDSITYGGSHNLIKKEVFDKCDLFDEKEVFKKGGQEDYEMWLRIAKKYNFDFTKEYLVKYYIRPIGRISTMANLQDKAKVRECIVGKFIEEYKKHPLILSNKLRRIGTLYCLGGNVKRGRRLFLRSIKYNFLNIRSHICLLISFFGHSFYNFFYKLNVKCKELWINSFKIKSYE